MNWFSIRAAAAADTAEISIYDEIGFYGVTAKAFIDALKQVTAKNIDLRIHSPGGSIFDGTAIFNALQRHPATITTHIDGLAASMASIVALAGAKVRMAANAMFMIHNPAGRVAGGADEMRDTAALLEKLKANMVGIYAKKTGKAAAEISRLMNAETWFTAAEAKAARFVDEVTPEIKATASVSADCQRWKMSAPGLLGAQPAELMRAYVKLTNAAERMRFWDAHKGALLSQLRGLEKATLHFAASADRQAATKTQNR